MGAPALSINLDWIHAPGYQTPPTDFLPSHLRLSAQVENCWKIKWQRKALELSYQVGLHNVMKDLVLNLITWGYTAPPPSMTTCHARERKQVLHLKET